CHTAGRSEPESFVPRKFDRIELPRALHVVPRQYAFAASGTRLSLCGRCERRRAAEEKMGRAERAGQKTGRHRPHCFFASAVECLAGLEGTTEGCRRVRKVRCLETDEEAR